MVKSNGSFISDAKYPLTYSFNSGEALSSSFMQLRIVFLISINASSDGITWWAGTYGWQEINAIRAKNVITYFIFI